jgi:hypothetical protein
MIEWVDASLIEWGRCVRGAVCKLGYPSSSIEARMADGALSINTLRSIPMVYFPENVELTERVIVRMPDYLEHLVQVAIVAYTTHGNMTRHEQAIMLSHRIGRRVRTRALFDMIDMLHNYYDGYYRAVFDICDDEKTLTLCAR